MYEIIVLQDQSVGDKQTIFLSVQCHHIPSSQLVEYDMGEAIIPTCKQEDEILSSVHVAYSLTLHITVLMLVNRQ